MLGWADRTSAGVKVEKIPGDHFTYMRQPHVRQLAVLLAKHLDKVSRENNQADSQGAPQIAAAASGPTE